MLISNPEYRIGQPALEFRVIAELLEELRVVLHHPDDHPRQRLVVLDPSVLLVGVLLRISIGGVGRDFLRDLIGDQLPDSVGVRPRNIAELT